MLEIELYFDDHGVGQEVAIQELIKLFSVLAADG